MDGTLVFVGASALLFWGALAFDALVASHRTARARARSFVPHAHKVTRSRVMAHPLDKEVSR